MLKVTSSDGKSSEVVFSDASSGTLDGNPFELDVLKHREGRYHVIYKNKSYTVDVEQVNKEDKTVTLKINGQKLIYGVSTAMDELLKKMGIADALTQKVSDLKAPMPGLVLDIVVEEGAEVAKGEPLLVLEAMKMENVLKSPTDGVVKKIDVNKGVAVEKNQILLHFD